MDDQSEKILAMPNAAFMNWWSMMQDQFNNLLQMDKIVHSYRHIDADAYNDLFIKFLNTELEQFDAEITYYTNNGTEIRFDTPEDKLEFILTYG